MKKLLLCLSLLLILSGCSFNVPSITRVDKLSTEQKMLMILPLKVKMHNMVGNGYKYYAPKGVVRIDSKDDNEVLKSGNNKYYLYVDVVNYYYKTPITYKVKKNKYYSDKIAYKGKTGYLEIDKTNNKMFIKMMYNYASIETYIDKKDLDDTVTNISYILSSIKFNDSLLTKMYEQGTLGSKEEVYKLFKNKEKDGNFIEYVEEYDKYDESRSNKSN